MIGKIKSWWIMKINNSNQYDKSQFKKKYDSGTLIEK